MKFDTLQYFYGLIDLCRGKRSEEQLYCLINVINCNSLKNSRWNYSGLLMNRPASRVIVGFLFCIAMCIFVEVAKGEGIGSLHQSGTCTM